MSRAVALAVALSSSWVATAWAQDETRAEESFQAGHSLLAEGKYTDACPKFEESQRQDPASGTLLALAYCQELSGHLASSWLSYLAAAQLATRDGQGERQKAAQERAQALSQRYSTLKIVVPPELGNLPGLRVLRDGSEIERSSFGTPLPLDGGTHSIEALAPGRLSWRGTVTLRSEADHKTLTLPVLETSSATANGAERPDGAEPPPNRLRQASVALAVTSGLALALGGVFGVLAITRNNASNEDGHCDARGCDAKGIELRNSAQSAASVSTWSFVAAGALAAASVTLYLTSSDSHSVTRIETGVSRGSAGLTLTRSF
ncbi:MAG TPA: hypothetical protein VIW29_08090 [Polyangiaceae bacterium]